MAIQITGTFEPTGSFPLAKAKDIEMEDGTRLSEFKGGVTSVNGHTGDVVIPIVNGKDGKDGVSATHSWNGTVLTVTSASGTSSADLKGEKGEKGDTGATGAKGDKGDKGDPGDGASITVDSALDPNSTNPVQNKTITAYFNEAVQTLGQLQASIPTEAQINALIDAYLSEALGGEY